MFLVYLFNWNQNKNRFVVNYKKLINQILNSERSNGCIDFTMICMCFFLCVPMSIRFTEQKLFDIQLIRFLCSRKVNPVGNFGSSKFKITRFPNNWKNCNFYARPRIYFVLPNPNMNNRRYLKIYRMLGHSIWL